MSLRVWLRGIRTRTALAAALAALVLFTGGAFWLRQRLYTGQIEATTALAREQVDQIIDQTMLAAQLGGDFGPLPYELVGGNGVIVSSSSALKPFENGAPVMPSPGFGASQGLYQTWTHTFPATVAGRSLAGNPLAGRTFSAVDGTMDARYVILAPGEHRPGFLPAAARYRVYVFVTTAAADTAIASVDPALWVGVPIAVLLVAATASLAVRRALRPVRAIQARTAEVTATDPRERVTVPNTADEIAALAVTINETLDRLETAAADQRRFIADAAHELRSPLTVLLSGLEIAQTYPQRADWLATLGQAVRSGHRLQLLVDDLLLLARLDAATTTGGEPVDLADLAAQVNAETQVETTNPATPTVRLQALRPVRVRGDAGQLRRLLRNLLDNALRHASSTVTISVTAEVAEGQATVEVTDDGAGIPTADRERIFERFTRLDEARTRDRGGAGLGLAIARDIARRHNATLIVVPDAPQTTFRVTFPLADSADSHPIESP